MTKVFTHIMFQGQAEMAVELYSSVFNEFQVGEVEKWREGEEGETGQFKLAHVSFAGHELLIFDSQLSHEFFFTPSMSLYVHLETQDELEAAFTKLSQEGRVMMPPGNYGFSKQFAWIADKFGVSWKLNLP